MKTLTSVIVSTKNNRCTIRYLLESVRTLAEKTPVELIVCDGGSIDGTSELLSEFTAKNKMYFADTQIIRDLGSSLSLSRCLGFKASHGDVLIFLDGDMILSCKFINKFVRHLNSTEFKRFDVLLHRTIVLPLDDATKTFSIYLTALLEGVKLELKAKLNMFEPRIVKREYVEELGCYPTLSKYFGEDKIFGELLLKAVKDLRVVYDEDLVIYKVDDPTYKSYILKHFRYGVGIQRDLSKSAKSLIRKYLLTRRLSYINILIPILSLNALLHTFAETKSFYDSFKAFHMKSLIDWSMLAGEILGILRRSR